jgi:hypothetical protein
MGSSFTRGMIRMNRLAICLSIAGLALAACGSESEPDATAAKPPQPAARPAAPEDPSARFARAVGNGKPGAAVEIRYDFGAKPTVGTPTELQIVFIPHAGVDSMDITVSGMEGVTLSGAATASFAEVEPQKQYTHTLSVLPDRGGVYYLSVVVTTQIGNSNLSRTFSIPFVVGNVPAQQKAAPQTDAAGEPVQPAKARETTRPG